VWEKGAWLLLGASFFINDVFLLFRLMTLEKAMHQKDKTEEQAKLDFEGDETEKDPELIHLKVNFAKLRMTHIFLLPFGIVYIFTTLGSALSNWFYWLTMGHVFADLYGAAVSHIHTKISLWITIGAIGLTALLNIIGLVYRSSETSETVLEELAILISVLYVLADAVILYYAGFSMTMVQAFERFHLKNT